jgi:hypothetical protein
MKKLTLLLLCSILTLSVAACSKAPTEEIATTKAAVDSAMGEGAEKYLPEDLKQVSGQLAAALDEVKVQDGKFLKNYDQAQQMLAGVKSQADVLKTKVMAVKEEQRVAAVQALGTADETIGEALAALETAPQGKGSLADIAMMKADVQGLHDSLQEVQPLIDSGDYLAASERASAIQGKAAAISEEVRMAQEKFAQLKKK